MRTAQALGIKCVAVFSEADRNSMHVKMVRSLLQNRVPRRSTDLPANRRTRPTSLDLRLRAKATFARTRSSRSAALVELRYATSIPASADWN